MKLAIRSPTLTAIRHISQTASDTVIDCSKIITEFNETGPYSAGRQIEERIRAFRNPVMLLKVVIADRQNRIRILSESRYPRFEPTSGYYLASSSEAEH